LKKKITKPILKLNYLKIWHLRVLLLATFRELIPLISLTAVGVDANINDKTDIVKKIIVNENGHIALLVCSPNFRVIWLGWDCVTNPPDVDGVWAINKILYNLIY